VTVLTEAFRTASQIRAKTLGMPEHPTVVVEHPVASKTSAEILVMAERFVDAIASGLAKKP
jgi:hypothetical protein